MKKVLAAFAAIYLFWQPPCLLISSRRPKRARKSEWGGLTLMRHPALDEIYRGYKVKIDYQNANNDQSNLKTMA